MIGRVVLSDELELSELGMRGEQTRADLVDQMLDRATAELVKDPLDLVADGAWTEKTRTFRDPILQIAVSPVHIHPDRERAIGELREGRVIVARERRERAAAGLNECDAFPAATGRCDMWLSVDDADGHPRHRQVRAPPGKPDLPRAARAGRG